MLACHRKYWHLCVIAWNKFLLPPAAFVLFLFQRVPTVIWTGTGIPGAEVVFRFTTFDAASAAVKYDSLLWALFQICLLQCTVKLLQCDAAIGVFCEFCLKSLANRTHEGTFTVCRRPAGCNSSASDVRRWRQTEPFPTCRRPVSCKSSLSSRSNIMLVYLD